MSVHRSRRKKPSRLSSVLSYDWSFFRDSTPDWVWKATAVVCVLILSAACIATAGLKWSKRYPVRDVSVVAAFHELDQAELRDAIAPLVNKAYWLSVDVEALHGLLTSMSWVKSAVVEKRWPDTLHIEITEPKPMAIWNDQWVMTVDGNLISAKPEQFSELPTLKGVEGKHGLASEFYQSLNTMLRNVDAKITRYGMESALHWEVMLDNGVQVIIEEDDYVEKMRRFISMYMSLSDAQQQQVVRVDARYDNGVAVEWKHSKNR